MTVLAALRRADRAGLVAAVLLVGASAVIVWDALRLSAPTSYGLGPQAVPMAVAAGLFLLGIGNLVMALRHDFPTRDDVDSKAVLLILAGLIALITLIVAGAGFITAIAILFACTAAAFGRRAFLTDLAIGLGLGTVIYLLFVKLLTLTLPDGPLERLL